VTNEPNEPMVRIFELDLEYLHRTIDKFDNQRFTIRNWAITTGGALVALAVASRNGLIPAVGLFVVLFFAYLEIVYMDMQVRVMERCTRVGELLLLTVSNPTRLPDKNYAFGIWAAIGMDPFRLTNVAKNRGKSTGAIHVLFRADDSRVPIGRTDLAASMINCRAVVFSSRTSRLMTDPHSCRPPVGQPSLKHREGSAVTRRSQLNTRRAALLDIQSFVDDHQLLGQDVGVI
jgi:hypothetical protein